MTWTSQMSSGSELGPRLMAPSELSLQLVMGHAIEVVYLMRGHTKPDDEDFQSLREAASTMHAVTLASTNVYNLQVSTSRIAEVPVAQKRSFAAASNPAVSFELLRAARQAFDSNDLQAVADRLVELGNQLNALSSNHAEGINLDEVLSDLRRIHSVLLARTSVTPDEVLGLASL